MPSEMPDSAEGDNSGSRAGESSALVAGGSGEQGSSGSDVASGETGMDDLDSEPEPFRPPGFLEAVKTVFRPNGQREKARPATGTDADAKAVNFIDRRERLIAAFLAGFQILLGFVIFFQYRRDLVHPSTKKPKVSPAQARLDTLNYHHQAPELLAVNLILGFFIFGGVLSKRRALVGFTLLLGGLGLNASGGGVIGLVYLGVGIWLVFRSMRRTPSARAAAAGNKGAGTGGRRERGAAKSSPVSGAAAALADRKPPPPSKRYTPPNKRRPTPVKVPVSAEPEKESRLASWLRR